MFARLGRLPSGGRQCNLRGTAWRLRGWRGIRTGFFPEDVDYLDPEKPLMAERLGSRWRYMDDAALQAPVLERSNVGMGMLVLNQADGLDLPAINNLYTRLRNLEVNTFKRFIGLTARDEGDFCIGIHPRELLLAAAATARTGHLPHFSRALLWHHQEVAHLIGDYRKPLVCHLSGAARNGGAALACLANFSGASESSEISVDACFAGLVPDGGMTYVLGRLQWHLGEFLALTGRPVRGADLIYCELIQHWLSPDALPFLELTSEKQLEVSETDARTLLDEHSLPVPEEAFLDPYGDSVSRFNLPLINDAFAGDSVPQITERLKKLQGSSNADEKAFAEDCLQRMSRACPLALHTTLRLIQMSREAQSGQLGGTRRWDIPGHHKELDALVESLRLELRVQRKLLARPDAVLGLHARCLGKEMNSGDWSVKSLMHVVSHDVDDLLQEINIEEEAGGLEDFSIWPRSEFTLSQHPRLRQYHPDYDPVMRTDHDPEFMAAEMRRWSPDAFEKHRRDTIEDLLDGADPALFGLSRWVRPAANTRVRDP